MDRGLPQSASEEIELYMRTYYSLLRSSGEIQIKALIETHTQTDSSLHVHARDLFPDIAAFVYATLRLPDCIKEVRLILLGQSDEVFEKAGYSNLCNWQEVSAPGRRRKGVIAAGVGVYRRAPRAKAIARHVDIPTPIHRNGFATIVPAPAEEGCSR